MNGTALEPSTYTQPVRQSVPASFRDPAGRVFRHEDRLFRILDGRAAAGLRRLLEAPAVRAALERGDLASTRFLDEAESRHILGYPGVAPLAASIESPVVIEHTPVAHPTYPYEWIPEMLAAAADLTLKLARQFLGVPAILKDATPYNVLFEGTRPVLVDVASIEARDPHNPTWLAYAQFARTFLLPLLLQRRFGIRPDTLFLGRWDGWTPEDVYPWLHWGTRLRSPYLGLVSMPYWLGKRHDPVNQSLYAPRRLKDPEQASYILESLFRSLEKQLRSCWPGSVRSTAWSGYEQSTHEPAYYARRESVVGDVIRRFSPACVLDIGCNTGRYSLLAARANAKVVGLDQDAGALAQLWHAARRENLDVLPLYANIARPSPAVGWKYQECRSLLERLRGQFDAVFMLAVIHHLVVTERVPMAEIASLAAELTQDLLVVEYIAPEDDLFRKLVRGREALYRDVTREAFERVFSVSFDRVEASEVMERRRWLYVLRKKKR